MQIIDFSSTPHLTNASSRTKAGLEIAAATLIFIIPALVLFVLAK